MPTRGSPTPWGCRPSGSLQSPAREPTRTSGLCEPPLHQARPAQRRCTPGVRTKQVLVCKTVRHTEIGGVAHRNRE